MLNTLSALLSCHLEHALLKLRKPKAWHKNSRWIHWPETYSVSLHQSQCLVVTPNKEVKQKTLFITHSMVQWFTLGIKVNKSSHAILRFRFEPGVRHYSCSARRTRWPARYRGSKCNVGKSPCQSDSATSYWQGQVTKSIPTSVKTFFKQTFWPEAQQTGLPHSHRCDSSILREPQVQNAELGLHPFPGLTPIYPAHVKHGQEPRLAEKGTSGND